MSRCWLRVVPDVAVTGGGAGGAGLTEALLGMLLRNQANGAGGQPGVTPGSPN